MIGLLRRVTTAARTRRRHATQAVRLEALTDRQLADIGLTRDGIAAAIRADSAGKPWRNLR